MFNRSFQKIYRKIILEEFNPILKQEFKELPTQRTKKYQEDTGFGDYDIIINGKYAVSVVTEGMVEYVIQTLEKQNDTFMLNQFKKYYKGNTGKNPIDNTYNAALFDIATNKLICFLDFNSISPDEFEEDIENEPLKAYDNFNVADAIVALAKGFTISSNLIQTFIKEVVKWDMYYQKDYYDRYKANQKQILAKRRSNNRNRFKKVHQLNDALYEKNKLSYDNAFSFLKYGQDTGTGAVSFVMGSNSISKRFLSNFWDIVSKDENVEKDSCGMINDPYQFKFLQFKPENINELKGMLGSTLNECVVFFISPDGNEFLGFIDFVNGYVYTPQNNMDIYGALWGVAYDESPEYINEFLKRHATSIDYYIPKVLSENSEYSTQQPVGRLWSYYKELFNKNNKSRFDGFTPSAESKNYLVYDVSLGEAYVLLTPEENGKHLMDHNYHQNDNMKLLVNKSSYNIEYVCQDNGRTDSPELEDQEALSLLGIEQQEE